jgi:hypothetical protein
MLLVDGVKYILWTPKDEEKEFHPMVKNCSKEIFGEDSVYFDIRHKLSSKSGIAAVPDAYVITLSKPYEWYIVENELASHPVYSHIVPQISKFVDSIEELETQRDIRDILDKEINEDVVLKAIIEKKTGQDSYRFLTELVSKPPKIALIIDKMTPEVEKASKSLNKLAGTRIIEFQTFSREDAPNVHAHLFEPLYVTEKVNVSRTESTEYSSFFIELVSSIRDRINVQLTRPRGKTYYKIPTGVSGVHFEWLFHRSSLGVELHFEKDNKDENMSLLRSLEKYKQDIERQTQEKVAFEIWGRKWTRLYLEKSYTDINDELKKWAVEKMVILYKLLEPKLSNLTSSS